MRDHPLLQWVTDSTTCFLIGAGCSSCAGKPLMPELSNRVLTKLSEPAKSLFDEIQGSNGRKATIEDLLTQLLQIKRILASRKVKRDGAWDLDKAEESIRTTLQTIAMEIGGEWSPSSFHERFFRRMANYGGPRTIDIFSLNYDVIHEATLELLQLPYVDGFRGAENAYFDPTLYDDINLQTPVFRIFKLHGSINWLRDDMGVIRRRPYKKDEVVDRHVIFPSEQKYFESQYGVYESLLSRMRTRLREDRPNNKLVVLGYSLSDDHITQAIIDAVCARGSNLTVYAFVGAEDDLVAQITRLQTIVDQCQKRFSVMIGDQAFLGPALEAAEWEAIKLQNLWKFENLVGALAG